MTLFYLVAMLALGTSLFAGVRIEPEDPRWGQELVIRVTPEPSLDTLYPGDQVSVGLTTYHQGLYRRATARAAFGVKGYLRHYIIDREFVDLKVAQLPAEIRYRRGLIL